MKRHFAARVALVVSASLLAHTAMAAPPKDDPAVKAARARFQEGVEFFDKGQYEQARAAFLQAYALRKHPAVLLNLAQSSLRSSHYLEATRFFQQFLREATTATPAQKGDAERGLAEARTKLGRIEVTAPTNLDVMVDGDRVGTAPLPEPVDVEPGTHVIKAGTEELRVEVGAGQRTTAKFGQTGGPTVVAPVPPPEPPPVAPVPAPLPSAEEPPAPAGPTPDAVHVSAKGSLLSPPKEMLPVYLGGGLALAGYGTAVAMLIAKTSAQDSANAVRDEIVANGGKQGTCAANNTNPADEKFKKACAALRENNDKVDTDALVGNIALGVGIAATAFTLGWYLFAAKDTTSAPAAARFVRPALSPWLAPGSGGLTVEGRF